MRRPVKGNASSRLRQPIGSDSRARRCLDRRKGRARLGKGMQNGGLTQIDVLRFLIAKAPGRTAVQLAVAIYAEKSAKHWILNAEPLEHDEWQY